ncbi:MAG: type VI secretion system tip protein VgrG [Pseudomonadales bacterium]|nr:type VI secretion system tip protein VgrG [Pseudomonadales bacterium]
MLPANASKFTFELIGLADSLRVLKFTGEEAISTPYVFTIDIVSENFGLTADKFMNKAGVLTLVDDNLDNRLIHGEVIQFHTQGHGDRFANYRIILVPKCQFMALKESTRIFQEKSIPTILKEVLGGSGISGYNVKFALSGNYPKRNYCVQYHETDLAFVERLMSEEGMFYFFEHHLDHHRVVISDRNSVFSPIAGSKAIPFHAKTGMAQATDSIYSFTHRTKVQTRVKCSNCANRIGQVPSDGICPECGTRPSLWEGYSPQNVTLGDFNPSSTQVGLGHQLNPDGDLENYRYPGHFETPDQAKKYTKIHLEADCVDLITGEGQTQCVRLLPGKLLAIKQHFTPAFNRPYLLTKVIHEGLQPQSLEEGSSNRGTEYQSTFYTMPNETAFRIQVHPKPKAYDHQTALVCGPGGEEIYTDSYGRIKVQFHWDLQGKMNDKSSLWIRVAQGFAGNGYGSMVVPRIGQEVIVQFEYGNPDRPIVTGSAFNINNTVPEGLPFNKTRTVFRSNSSPDGDGHNELRIDDKKGKEQVYLHAEKDLDLRIKNDLKQHIQKDQHRIVTKQHNENIGKDKHLDVGGNSNLEVGDSLSLKVGKDLHLKSGNNHFQQSQQTHLKAATTLVVDGGMALTVKGGAGILFLSPAGVIISGPMVRINSGGGGAGAQSASPAAPAEPTPPANDKAGKVAKPGSAMIVGGNGWMVTDHRKGGKITMPTDATSTANAEQTDLALLASTPLIATPVTAAIQEKDWLKIHLFWDDKHDTPAKGHPYKLLLADGSTREGELDDKGEAFEENLPTGTVQIEYISREEEQAKLTQLRNQLSTTLNNIVADAQRDADMQQIVADSTSAFEMGLVCRHDGRLGYGE